MTGLEISYETMQTLKQVVAELKEVKKELKEISQLLKSNDKKESK